MTRGGLHEHLRCGSRADREVAPVAAAQPHAVGRVVALLDLDDLPGLSSWRSTNRRNSRILIADALTVTGAYERAGEERVVARPADRAVRVRNRIAVRVDRGPAEHLVDPVDQPIRHGVLQVFRLVVHLGPAHAHDPDEKQFDQPVPAQDQRGELLARPASAGRRRRARIAPAPTRPASSPSSSPCPGRRPERDASWPIGTRASGASCRALRLENGLEVVLDGGGRQHLTSVSQNMYFE